MTPGAGARPPFRAKIWARRFVSRVLSTPFVDFPTPDDRWPFIWDARRRAPHATHPDGGAETRLSDAQSAGRPSLFGFAPGGVYHARPVAGAAVRSYRTLSPLPVRKLRVPIGRYPFCGTFPGVAPAGHYPAPCFRGARTFLGPQGFPGAVRGHPTVWPGAYVDPGPTLCKSAAAKPAVSASASLSTLPGRKCI